MNTEERKMGAKRKETVFHRPCHVGDSLFEAAERFDALAVLLSAPLSEEERNIAYEQAVAWAEALRKEGEAALLSKQIEEATPAVFEASPSQRAGYDYDREHPEYPVSDWRNEVAGGDTKLGYVEWLDHRLEDMANSCQGPRR